MDENSLNEQKNDEVPSGGQGMYFSNKLQMTIFGWNELRLLISI